MTPPISPGRSRTPKAGTGAATTVDGLPFFLQAEQLNPFISDELRESTTPIFFRLKDGQRAVGYDANLLPMVCEVYLRLRDAYLADGKHPPKQYKHIIEACDLLMRGLAHVGITALVDEATGFQEVRDRMALQQILEKYIQDEWARWTRRFPPEFYKELFRLKNIPFPPSQGTKKPSYVGHWTNDIVYARLAPGVLAKLREVNPRTPSGSRARKHHQHLTEDHGVTELQQHISNATFLMKTCKTWAEFKERLDIAAPKVGETLSLPLTTES